MRYLITKDYSRTIQDATLSQIIAANEAILLDSEISSQSEAVSYLRQKYDISKEFTDTSAWIFSATYNAATRVYLDAAAYNSASTYNTNNLTLQSSKVYQCNTDGTTGAFDLAKWNLLGAQYDLFFAAYPFPLFNLGAGYNVGDKVFWKNKTYTCLVATRTIDHDNAIQYNQISNLPSLNVFPDDVTEGSKYWKDEGTYSIAANTPISDAAWTAGDNRDRQMVMFLIDITLYHLHSRISPRNISQLRIDRYDAAIEWLKMCAKGDVTPALPLIQPKQGNRIRYGGQVRNINSY